MIKFSSVTKQFPPDVRAIDNVSFEIDPGELVLLTGPSGSGKTTIMKLLTRECLASKGDIYFSDLNLNNISGSGVHEHKRKIGVVFQDYKLLPELNVWENIALPLSIVGKEESEIEQRVTDLLSLVSLTEKAFLFPKQLSGGEAQRISIARALSTGPGIIFADEPTGNLDRETSLEIGRLIQKINSLGTTVILATHDHDIMDMFNNTRNIELEKGKISSDSKKVEKIAKAKKVVAKTDGVVIQAEDRAKTETDNGSKKTDDGSKEISRPATEKKPRFWSKFARKKVAKTEAPKVVEKPKTKKKTKKSKKVKTKPQT